MPEEILSNVDPSFSRSSNLGYNVYTLLLPRTRFNRPHPWKMVSFNPKGYPIETDVPPQSRMESLVLGFSTCTAVFSNPLVDLSQFRLEVQRS